MLQWVQAHPQARTENFGGLKSLYIEDDGQKAFEVKIGCTPAANIPATPMDKYMGEL